MGGQANTAALLSTRGTVCAAALVLLPAAWAQAPPERSAAAPAPIREGAERVAGQEPGERISYGLEAEAGRSYVIEVEQRDLDLVVTWTDPTGASRSYDSPLLRDEREIVLVEDAAGGAHRVTIHSDEHTGATGAHAIRVEVLDPRTRAREIEAWSLMSRGGALHRKGGERRSEALGAYEQAAALWRGLGRDRAHAQAVYSAARLHYDGSDWEAAADAAERAAAQYGELGHAALSANASHLRGAALIESAVNMEHEPSVAMAPEAQALFDEALALFEQARGVHESLGRRYDVGRIVNNMGLAHFYMGELASAKTYWQRAVEIFRRLDERTAELKPLANQAVIDAEQGYLTSAIESFQRVLEILPRGEEHEFRAYTLDNLAAAQRLFGNFDEALQRYSAALEIRREIGDALGEAYSLRGIGQAYFGLGELDLAAEYLERALEMLREADDGAGRLTTLMYLGRIAYFEQDYERALERHKAALSFTSSPLDVAYVRELLARDRAALGEHAAAERLAEQARETAEALDERKLLADALLELGRARTHLGDPAAAQASLEQALAIYEALSLQGEQADALHALALAAKARGALEQATRHAEASLEKVEQLRGRVADPELRAVHAALRRDYYDTQIELLLEMHRRSGEGADRYLREAFAVSERARARMLMDLLTEAAVDLREGMDPELLDRRRALYEQLAEHSRQRDLLLEAPATEPKADTDERVAAIVEEMSAIENELNLVETQLRRENPRFASLSTPRILGAREVQQRLSADAVLLQYSLGSDRSYVWVLTRNSIGVVELADRERIESAARAVLEALRRFRPAASGPEDMSAELSALSALVLEPIAERLTGRRVLVAADGALEYVPFGVLPMGTSGASRLLEGHEVVAVPSMSSMAAQLERAPEDEPAKRLAVFADPVLGLADARLGDAVASDAGRAGRLRNGSASPVAADDLGRLPATGHEARTIAALLPERERDVATGFAASREAVLNANLREYELVHFATHGIVDARYPDLSALVLSRFDERGRPRDGFLRLHDVYNLELDAELVVLSACETALGRSIRGEGLIGLAQGFMYAGAGGVVASLWQVPDRATQELMTRFYRHIFMDGDPPAAALRQAQLSIAAERRWRDPFFWGAFVLVGGPN